MGTMTLPTDRDTAAAWLDASARVDALLRACGVADAALRGERRAEILDAVRHQHSTTPGAAPAALAVAETQRRFAAWIDGLLEPDPAVLPAVRQARGRAAVHLADLPGRRPDLMLAARPVPPELMERIRELNVAAGPDFTFGNMAPRPIDLGPISSMADETWRTFARWPVLRGVLAGLVFFTLLGTAFYLARF